jgi:hypothetical protein
VYSAIHEFAAERTNIARARGMTRRFAAPKAKVFLRPNHGASNIAGGIVRLRSPPFRKRERRRPSATWAAAARSP